MKQFAKSIVLRVLKGQVRRLRKRHKVVVVAVAGSIGKTSTKFAVARLLGATKRVRFQEGNYNDIVTVPLVFFGTPLPSLFNPLAWVRTFWRNERQIHGNYAYDVVVVELGTDGPGQLARFKDFIAVDIGILTAIAPEHMEFFDSLRDVAREELVISDLAKTLLINSDLCAPEYIPQRQMCYRYGIDQAAAYTMQDLVFDRTGYSFTVAFEGKRLLQASHPSIAIPQLYSLLAAVAVANQLGMSEADIRQGLAAIAPVSGRMQLLRGLQDSTIIDETYNASPEACKAALRTLYQLEAPQKIALLGSMNELGAYSPAAHAEVGAFCDPKQLALVVTLGSDANQYLAPAAEERGCTVVRVASPYEAAGVIKQALKQGAAVLAKGSQNGVFAEEAVKLLLADPTDANKLVRQSASWQKIKAKQFSR
ncbi:MAG TPA: UDP-N-acetylmuramoyl-tripeptide--D-alanyl-D-alanine ligase [Candidatus Saccharimonadales bacterium]|nr:UDP-N-acetylmuramoyl-tripeptide--D-alanyl-D-alanine ligase [Candidatus Saccharimonadales bacterium]